MKTRLRRFGTPKPASTTHDLRSGHQSDIGIDLGAALAGHQGESAAHVVCQERDQQHKEFRAVRRTCGVDDAMRPAGISKLLKLFSNVLYDRWLPINAIQQAFYLHTSIITLQAYMVYEHIAWVLRLLCMMPSILASLLARQ